MLCPAKVIIEFGLVVAINFTRLTRVNQMVPAKVDVELRS